MKVYAPVKNANGIYANTLFTNGVGETDNECALNYFRAHGYIVEESDSEPIERISHKSDSSIDDKPDFSGMSVDELRNWMKANGLGSEVRNIQNKEKLLEIIRRNK